MPVIVPQGVLTRGDLSGWFGRHGGSLAVVGTMNLMYNAACFVQEGYGCAIGPAGLVDTSWESQLTFRPLDPPMRTSLAIAWKRNQPMTPAAAAFLEELRKLV
ncbi:LysR-type transcriptional regulator [Bifidobacterium samirii]|uniref:LysR-type transcriptional regulator n=1 Tax=Bifidobacterium samirii TaxID=2306974 RepID=A0A430FUT2_9BIFI|nr:LysR-type transcriptional regulator [Bifidobacterium samirii]